MLRPTCRCRWADRNGHGCRRGDLDVGAAAGARTGDSGARASVRGGAPSASAICGRVTDLYCRVIIDKSSFYCTFRKLGCVQVTLASPHLARSSLWFSVYARGRPTVTNGLRNCLLSRRRTHQTLKLLRSRRLFRELFLGLFEKCTTVRLYSTFTSIGLF